MTVLRNVKEYSRKRSKFSDAHCKEKNKVGQSIFVFTCEPGIPAQQGDDQRVSVRDGQMSFSLCLPLKDLPSFPSLRQLNTKEYLLAPTETVSVSD